MFISLLTLFVAIFIANTIDRNKKKEEYYFSFLLGKLKEMKDDCKDLMTLISDNDCELHLINSKLKNISMGCSGLKELLGSFHFPIESQKEKSLRSLLKHIKRLATESRRYDLDSNVIKFQESTELQINDNIITYSEQRKDMIKVELGRLNSLLFKIVVK